MSEQRTNNLQLLKDAQLELSSYENMKNIYSQQTAELKQIAKQLSAETKAMENDIAAAVKRKRNEIEKLYSEDLRRLEDDLKKARTRKEKAKSKGIKKRIRMEIEPLEEENDILKESSRSELKSAGISPIFNTPAFYRLFSPKGAAERLTLAALFIIIGLCIPAGIYFLIPEHKIFHLVILCAVFIAALIALYVLIYKATKGKNQGAILHARKNYDLICVNKRKIKALIHSIETDTDESMYKLSDHNESLSKAEDNYSQLHTQYEQAMDIFENQKRPSIENDIRNSYGEQLMHLENDLNQKKSQCDQSKHQLDKIAENLEENFTSIIGKRYMKMEVLAKLETIISQYEAETIEDAIEVMKSRK